MSLTVVLSSVLVLSVCGGMSTAIKKRILEVKTQMIETIWLEPSSQKTVYIQIKNTSDKDMSGLQAKVTKAVQDKG
ncbi:complement resistance protein TraT, partial [Salmonella enterica]|uniref:complement resistance protein TraT n=1 Tax=Salmonella enterica TaxID=28901 RepID=UPI001F37001A